MVNKLSGSVGHGRAWLGTHVRGAYRGSLSVVLKSKKLFGEGDVGYGKILETRQILNEGDCKG